MSAGTLTAAILASDIATAQTAVVTVHNPSPGGGSSNPAYFEVTTPSATLAMSAYVVAQADIATSNQQISLVPSTVAVADFNGDGKLDIAVLTGVLLGNGDGTFQAPIPFPAGVNARSLVVADVNGDGKPDLVLENSNTFAFTVLLGNGDGSFQAPIAGPVGNNGVGYDFILGDFNGDGRLDLAALGPLDTNHTTQPLTIYPGNGDGTFGTPFFSATMTGGDSLASADLNGDGKLDLAVCASNAHDGGPLTVYLGNGDGSFQPPKSNSSCRVVVAFADLDGDGKPDELTWGFLPPNPGSLDIYLGNGDGTFRNSFTQDLAAGLGALTDLDGDGKIDLFARNPQSSVSGVPDPAGLGVFLGSGNGFFQAEAFVGPNAGFPLYAAGNGDFNGDGKMDLLAVDHSGHLWVLLQGLFPIGTASPTTVSLGNSSVGVASPPQIVTLSNTGGASLNLSGVTIEGTDAAMFTETNTCGTSLAAGASCQVQVIFTPTAGGIRNAALKFVDNSAGGPQLVSVTGTGQDFSVGASGAASVTVTAGQTASYTISIAPSTGFNQSVSLTCSGVPAMSTCAVSPGTVSLNGTSAMPATVTVTTTAHGSLLLFGTRGPIGIIGAPVIVVLLAITLTVLNLSLRLHNQRFGFAPAFALALVCIALTLTSCGGGSGGSPTGGSPAGNYMLTVSATAGSGSAVVTHTTSLTLIVQ